MLQNALQLMFLSFFRMNCALMPIQILQARKAILAERTQIRVARQEVHFESRDEIAAFGLGAIHPTVVTGAARQLYKHRAAIDALSGRIGAADPVERGS